ncbi:MULTISPECIES: hypothetical protein [unclassified Leifsonia]|uniref:hypothetical protein n=1 Tax=unclassified Leifsonia TaxID=2663824 RepID=UPI00070107F3|nr:MULTISPECIES: hypothetical protein [unclassified Leifsonia]KQX08406.1 hypothetical protein ASC59_03565 [Leifsonia sp. Root1293]KRA12688.1 hypothetical protein ASD61_03565 [Leifsonia sp. Root60]
MRAADHPDLLIIGPQEHGVVQYAHELAAAAQAQGLAGAVHASRTVESAAFLPPAARVHLHVTDRLFGSTPEEAADNLERLASATSLSITLHDLPQESDGAGYSRRASAYARFVGAAQAVAVNSEHEARLLAEHVDPSFDRVAVIPLGARMATPQRADPPATSGLGAQRPLTALIAGYIYPGKGHGEVIDAVADARDRLQVAGENPGPGVVVAIGGPSLGHEADVDALRARADALGVHFEATGYLDGPSYRSATVADGIPVAAHQHLSASRSMLDWIEQGRRPLVPMSRYAAEMAALRPGTMALYDPARLSTHLMDAWRQPGSTRLPVGTALGPTMDDVASAYGSWWAGLAAR